MRDTPPATREDTGLVLSAWCGPLFCLIFGVGLVPLAGFIPPPRADFSADQVVGLYSEHHVQTLSGLVVMMASTVLFPIWVGAITQRLRGPAGTSVYGYAQLAAGGAQTIVIGLPVLVMIVAAFRVERDPQLTVLLNDLGWILFVMNFAPLATQMISTALGILNGTATGLPRWLAYFSVWCAVLLVPAVLLPFFKSGPFAWHGIFEFWLAATVFFAWIMAVSASLIRGARKSRTAVAR